MELADLAHPSGGGSSADHENEGAGALLQNTGASVPFFPHDLRNTDCIDYDLTPEELLYLKVYENKLEDSGFVESGAPPNTPAPWQFRHKTPVMTQLRLIRWFAFLLCAGIGGGTGIFLLVTTVQVRVQACCSQLVMSSSVSLSLLLNLLQGYQDPVLQSTPVPTKEYGLYVPLFAVCGTILQPISYSLSGDEPAGTFVTRDFGVGFRDNLFISANDTMRQAYATSSSLSTSPSSPACFKYNILQSMLPPGAYTPLIWFLTTELFKNKGFSLDAWQPCIV